MLSVTAQWLQSAESQIVYQNHRCIEDFAPHLLVLALNILFLHALCLLRCVTTCLSMY